MKNVNQAMSMEDFAEHEGSARGAREFLSWKDQDGGKIDVWLAADPWKLWRHSWHRVAKFKEDGAEREMVRMYSWNTMESDEELVKKIKKQGYYADGDEDRLDERRVATVDPFLMMLEWVYRAVITGVIDWTDPVFKFEPADGDDLVIHAGGLLKMYPNSIDDVAEEERKKFKKQKIVLKDVFKENAGIGLKYLLTVIDNDKPEEGAKIAIESEALGNAIKTIYKHRKERFDDGKRSKADVARLANPVRQLCMRWKFDNDKAFSAKYEVISLEKELSPEIVQAFERDLPDIEPIVGPGNVAVLEQNFREYWCHEVTPPWKEIFAEAYKAVAGTDLATLPSEDGSRRGRTAPAKGESDEDAEETESAQEASDTVACEACGKDMPGDSMQCPHCKAQYVEVKGPEGEFISLRDQKCSDCGETWHAEDLKCEACGTEYLATEEGFKAKPKPKSEPAPTGVRAPRRQQGRKAT